MRFEAVWKLKTNLKISILFITNIWITWAVVGGRGEKGVHRKPFNNLFVISQFKNVLVGLLYFKLRPFFVFPSFTSNYIF